MASLILLSRFTRKYASSFRPINNIPEALVAGGTKLYVEHNIILTEGIIVTGITTIPAYISNEPSYTIVPALLALIYGTGTYVIPAYRLFDSVTNKKLKIINI